MKKFEFKILKEKQKKSQRQQKLIEQITKQFTTKQFIIEEKSIEDIKNTEVKEEKEEEPILTVLHKPRKILKFSTLNITMKLNNIFACVTSNEGKISKFTVPLRSATQLGLKISKVTTRFYLDEFLDKYFKFIENSYNNEIISAIQDRKKKIKKKKKIKRSITFKKTLALNLTCPPKYKQKIMRKFFKYVSEGLTAKRNILLDIRASKNFNGCRGKKLLRKKRLKIKYLNRHLL